MSTFEFTVDCAKEVGDLPALSQAVMGNMSYNLLRTGVRLQKTLEGISEQPLCRRIMCPLSTGTGIDKGTGVYCERADGTPIYDFTILDQILACMISPRSVPFFGVAFMPEDLSGALELAAQGDESDQDLPPEAKVQAARARLPEPWMHIDRFPPRDYQRWYEVVHTVACHLVERYGEAEVSRWYFDFWNEPDLRFYWPATHEEFFKTYDFAAAAIREALPSARVGGCGPASPRHPIFKEFLEHCTSGKNYCTGEKGAPLDFVTFHVKGGPTGRKGIFPNPWEATGYETRHPSLTHIIDTVRWGLELIASIEGTKGLPVFLTECDIDWGTGTSIYYNPNMHYRNSEYFPAFQCAMTKRMLDLRAQFPDNPVERTFLDTFYFPGYRIFEGQRTLITGECIDKPLLNGLRLLGKLGSARLSVTESKRSETPPGDAAVEVLASTTEVGAIRVMAVNFNEEFGYSDSHTVRLQLEGLAPGSWRCLHYRVDHDHSNAYTVWQSLGRPVVPDDRQLAAIQERMGVELVEPEFTVAAVEGSTGLETTLPPQSVSLWVLEKR